MKKKWKYPEIMEIYWELEYWKTRVGKKARSSLIQKWTSHGPTFLAQTLVLAHSWLIRFRNERATSYVKVISLLSGWPKSIRLVAHSEKNSLVFYSVRKWVSHELIFSSNSNVSSLILKTNKSRANSSLAELGSLPTLFET